MPTSSPAGRPSPEGAGPPPLPEESEARRERWLARGFAATGLAVLLVAAMLDPYDDRGLPRSHGTHRQLGLPACTFQSLTGIGCPSCGMTTSFALLAHGDPIAAWNTNWAGCAIAALAVVGTAWFLAVALGLPPGRLTADEVVKVMTMVGMGLAMVRWLAILGATALATA